MWAESNRPRLKRNWIKVVYSVEALLVWQKHTMDLIQCLEFLIKLPGFFAAVEFVKWIPLAPITLSLVILFLEVVLGPQCSLFYHQFYPWRSDSWNPIHFADHLHLSRWTPGVRFCILQYEKVGTIFFQSYLNSSYCHTWTFISSSLDLGIKFAILGKFPMIHAFVFQRS